MTDKGCKKILLMYITEVSGHHQATLAIEKSLKSLNPRLEILNIIRDHELVSLDFIARRFLAVNPRTLRCCLKALVDVGLVAKHGTTKGVFYSASGGINLGS